MIWGLKTDYYDLQHSWKFESQKDQRLAKQIEHDETTWGQHQGPLVPGQPTGDGGGSTEGGRGKRRGVSGRALGEEKTLSPPREITLGILFGYTYSERGGICGLQDTVYVEFLLGLRGYGLFGAWVNLQKGLILFPVVTHNSQWGFAALCSMFGITSR